jgi:glucosamine--fructose-6-phosphate aminotransferase (isomerizing)
MEGLQQLEYRGYDSAGVAALRNGELRVHKCKGKVRELEAALPKRLKGSPGIGHTRWATHGVPSDANAHPHVDASGNVAVVHNGIIENAGELRAMLEGRGVEFASETDSEVLAHLIGMSEASELEDAVRDALAQVAGTYGIAVVDVRHPDRIVVARNGSPVIVGIGQKEMFVASDVSALVAYTQQVVHLDDGEIAVLRADGYRTISLDGAGGAEKSPLVVDLAPTAFQKDGHEHFMHKEISEQPDAVERALGGRLDHRFATAHLGGLNLDPRDALALRRVKIIGCGSAYHAGLAGALMVEALARIPADAEPASEFRYRNPVIEPDVLYVAVSQSGETFDTLAAVQEIRRKGGRVLGIVNVVGSTVARECDGGIYLHAGPEVSVCSTKTFTATQVAFTLLALYLGRIRDLGPADGARIIAGLDALPDLIREALAAEDHVAEVAKKIAAANSAFYVGRIAGYPVALEGALKIKEVSYVHAEAYPCAELKHGPLALVSPEIPTVAVVPDDHLLEKNVSTVEEVRARRGQVIAVTHPGVDPSPFDDVLVVPKSEPELDPIVMGVPLQLLAYHAALALDRDVDQPRNLAKSVTVE